MKFVQRPNVNNTKQLNNKGNFCLESRNKREHNNVMILQFKLGIRISQFTFYAVYIKLSYVHSPSAHSLIYIILCNPTRCKA